MKYFCTLFATFLMLSGLNAQVSRQVTGRLVDTAGNALVKSHGQIICRGC